MSGHGHGVQIVKVAEDHTFQLDEYQLQQILMKNDAENLPVVVVSVAGAYRTGKSFMLNFFLRYLTSPSNVQRDGSWLGEESDPLVGFEWRSGLERTTKGIIMWSEPFVVTLPSGQKVAVLLIDTQGAFDSVSTVKDASTIFALSTLLSSVQIFNISQNIQEDDLQHLQLFTEYGKLVKETGATAFQVLQFLVRDWKFSEDHPYGAVGGEELLQDLFQITPTLAQELKDLRLHLRSSFEKVSCFLMPHPGFAVLSSNSKGNISELDIQFRVQLNDFVTSLLSPEKLLPKLINGEEVKTNELLDYFRTYINMFNSKKIPNPGTLLEATVDAGLLLAYNQARKIYEDGMEAECGPKELSVPAADLKELHNRYVEATKTIFNNKKKMGSKEKHDATLKKLIKELEVRLPQLIQINLAKIQTAVNEAKTSYEDALNVISKDQLLCVHPLDLEKIHRTGLEAALKTFDSSRRKLTNNTDYERAQFIQSFEKRYDLLRATNEQNNMVGVYILSMSYWQKMQVKQGRESSINDKDLTRNHENALKQALDDFAAKRSIQSKYTEDVYKTKLITMINNSFVQIKALNKSMNSYAIQAAVGQYDNRMKSSEGKCLHPTDLEHEHQKGLCSALLAFRPNRNCSDGFDYRDSDEVTLKQILDQRYERIQGLNEYANKYATQEAFSAYTSSMDDLCRPSLHWFLILPMVQSFTNRTVFHEKSKAQALEVFNSKRQHTGQFVSSASDPFKDHLLQMMDEFFQKRFQLNGIDLLSFLSKVPQLISLVKKMGGTSQPQGTESVPQNEFQ